MNSLHIILNYNMNDFFITLVKIHFWNKERATALLNVGIFRVSVQMFNNSRIKLLKIG